MRLLTERGYSFITADEGDFVRDTKEKSCYVAMDFQEEMVTSFWDIFPKKMNYELPDDKVITIKMCDSGVQKPCSSHLTLV
jgi:hypothetical protein